MKMEKQHSFVYLTSFWAKVIKQITVTGINGLINIKGKTPSQIAAEIQQPEIFLEVVTQLQPHKAHNPLCVALSSENEDLLDNILERITNKSCYCKEHKLPLLSIALERSPDYAPFSYDPDISFPIKVKQVRILLKHGIHPNCTSDQHLYTNIIPLPQGNVLPIKMAVDNMLVMVPVLLQHGAYVNFSSVSGADISEDTPHMMIIEKIPSLHEPYGPDWSSWPHEYKLSSNIYILQDFISAGAKISKTSVNMKTIVKFEKVICGHKEGTKLVKHLLESGYRFTVDVKLSSELQAINSEPCSLLCLTAQKIRNCLMPNAWVGVKQLSLPTLLKKYVVMNSSDVDL